jgi:hypothetical protein
VRANYPNRNTRTTLQSPATKHVAFVPRCHDFSTLYQLQQPQIMDLDADDPAVHHYNDGNRAFLQAIMARGTLTLKEGKVILAAIFTVQEGL